MLTGKSRQFFTTSHKQALDKAALEFERDYLPDLERRIAEAKARDEAAKEVGGLLTVETLLFDPC